MKLIVQGTYAKELFDNKVVDPGVPGKDSQVMATILKSTNYLFDGATNKPSGPDLTATSTKNRADTTPTTVQRLYAAQQATSTSIVLLGESHVDPADRQRAENYLEAMNATPPTFSPSLVVFERGLTYKAPNDIPLVRESNLTTVNSHGNMIDFGMQLSRAQRSMVIAGYLALYVGSGNQQDINRIILFYGANHDDIYKYFDYIVSHTSVSFVLKEKRDFFNIRSNV